MEKLVKNTPYAICGLCLGMASLATIFKEVNCFSFSYLLAGISAVFIGFVLTKIMRHFPLVKKEFQNIGVASTAPTLTMTIQILTTFLLPITSLKPLLTVIWWMAVLCQYFLMANYVVQFFIKPKKTWDIVYPSWFVTLVGIGVITVTSPNYYLPIGKAMFYLGLVLYLVALPFVLYRVFVYKKLPEGAKPLATIIAAPGSLLLAGYLSAFSEKQSQMIWFLMILSQILYLVSLGLVAKNIRLPFYPSFGGFTFPTVISAKALKGVANYYQNQGGTSLFFRYVANVEFFIATAIVLYVLYQYLSFLNKKVKKDS